MQNQSKYKLLVLTLDVLDDILDLTFDTQVKPSLPIQTEPHLVDQQAKNNDKRTVALESLMISFILTNW